MSQRNDNKILNYQYLSMAISCTHGLYRCDRQDIDWWFDNWYLKTLWSHVNNDTESNCRDARSNYWPGSTCLFDNSMTIVQYLTPRPCSTEHYFFVPITWSLLWAYRCDFTRFINNESSLLFSFTKTLYMYLSAYLNYLYRSLVIQSECLSV